ncbi:MAG: hypothetical protein WB797_05750 [Nocardioides sp.]
MSEPERFDEAETESDDEHPEAPQDQLSGELSRPIEEQELTPEEEAELRRAAARIRSVLNPHITSLLADIQKTGALARFQSDYFKFGRLHLSDSVLKGITGKGVLDTSLLGKGALARGLIGPKMPSTTLAKLMPATAVDPQWAKNLQFINSDMYKLSGVGQAHLATLNSVLAKNADFGFNKQAARWAAQFASQQNSWLKTIGPRLASLTFRIYPANLQAIEGLEFQSVEQVVMLDGIALYGVPRTAIAQALIEADSSGARREILGRRWKAISADCRAAMDECENASVVCYIPFALAALDALDGGNPKAAQALAASVLDTIVNGYFGNKRYDLTPSTRTTTTVEYENFTVREFIAFAPLWQAYQKFRVEHGDPIPRTFSRHASVHGVSSRQFSRRNAIQVLMFVCGLLLFLDEEATSAEAA